MVEKAPKPLKEQRNEEKKTTMEGRRSNQKTPSAYPWTSRRFFPFRSCFQVKLVAERTSRGRTFVSVMVVFVLALMQRMGGGRGCRPFSRTIPIKYFIDLLAPPMPGGRNGHASGVRNGRTDCRRRFMVRLVRTFGEISCCFYPPQPAR